MSRSAVRSRLVPLLAASVVVAVTLTACSSGSPNSSSSSSSSSSSASSSSSSSDAAGGSTSSTSAAANGGGSATGAAANIFVVGGKSDDPFWSKVKRGVDDAAKVVEAGGGKVTWLGPADYNNLGPDAAKLIQNAKSQGATAIIGADWVPDAEDSAFQDAIKSGIPVFLYNAGGVAAAKKIGALTYTGNEEEPAGKAGGAYFGQNGVKNVLCVNTLPGSDNTEARCKGVSEGISGSGGKSTQLPLAASNFGNPTAVTQAIKAALLKDDTIDAVMTISAGDADSAAGAIEQGNLSGKVKLGTFDMDSDSLSRIKSGKQLFSIDQQPYLQGYLAVSQAYAYNKYGLIISQDSIATGPAIVNSSNVDAVLAGVQAGVR